MLTPQDVHAVQFEKSFRGYRIEDVDRFLDRVEEQLKAGAAEADRLQRQTSAQGQPGQMTGRRSRRISS